MKTPREILLARHRSAEPQLAAMRRRILTPAEESHRGQKPSLARLAESCCDFFRIPRPAWAALGAAWALIIALNIASSDTPNVNPGVASATTKRSPEMLQALREQKRLFAELVGSLSAPDAEAPRFVPRPRSERQPQLVLA